MTAGIHLLFDVSNLFLLLVIRLHLVHLVLALSLDETGVITSIVNELRDSISFRIEETVLTTLAFFLGVSSIIFVQMVSIKS